MPDEHTLTAEQSAVISNNLFKPAAARMKVIADAIVSTTGNADLAFWLPLSVMEEVMADTKLNLAEGTIPEDWFAVCVAALRRFADRFDAYREALTAWRAAGAVPPLPPFPIWTSADSARCYAVIDTAREEPTL